MERADVVIVGGGFVGLAAAAALADGRRRVVVLEARSGADPRFRGELIHPPGVHVLSQLRLLAPLCRAGGVPVQGFAVIPEAGQPALVLPYHEVPMGSCEGLSMDHHAMVACLRGVVEALPGVEVRTGQRVLDVVRGDAGSRSRADGAQPRVTGVRLASGEDVEADLTIVAEGRHSKLRRLLGFAEESRLLSFTAALLVEGGELPNPGYGHVFLGMGGPILAYPIGQGRVRMCIDLPTELVKGQEAVVDLLRERYAPFMPPSLRRAMLRALSTPPEICANHAIYTASCAAPGVALVGDSGGCSHPLTATGMTTGLNDIRILARQLRTSAGDTDAALGRYQRQRYAFVRARELLAEALYEVFRGDQEGTRAIRSGIFRYWRSSARARGASMALLSGHESRLSSFFGEYVRVLGQSTRCVVEGDIDEPSVRGRAASMSGLLRTSYAQLERTVSTVYQDALA